MKTFCPKGKIHGPILPMFILQKKLTFGAKTVYAILCDYAAENDHCWPSQATLANRLSCSVSSIKNYLGELVRENLIIIKREQYRSSVYYLLTPESNSSTQETTFDDIEPKNDYAQPKFGYLNTLKKQKKENITPLSPKVKAESAASVACRTPRTPSAGGVSSSLHDFEDTWALYPKKEAKGFARMAWFKLLRSGQLPALPEIHAAIRRFADSESWQREQGRFIPQMGNWLRGQRWLDSFPSAEMDETAQDRATLQAIRAIEEREQRLTEQYEAKRAKLRPLFDAFAAKFPPLADDAMPFGIWQYLHSQNSAPSAADVPPENTLGIIEFLNKFRRCRPTTAFPAKLARLSAGHEATPNCHQVGTLLENLPAFFPKGKGCGQSEHYAMAYA